MKVLVADDDPINRRLIVDALALVNCQVIEAETGKQAIEMAKSQIPDLILMDHTMPEMHGYEALKEIRKHSNLLDIPCVMITGDFEVQIKQEDDKMKKCAFLPKPYSIDQLMTTIGRAMGKTFPP